MTEMSQGEMCRVHVANIRTMCDEIEELLTIGALHGFGRVLDQLTATAARMESAVTTAADAAGAVNAGNPEGVAAELAAQDKREQGRQRADAFASYDLVGERAKLIRMAGGVPPEDARAQRRDQRRQWASKGGRVTASRRRAAEMEEG